MSTYGYKAVPNGVYRILHIKSPDSPHDLLEGHFHYVAVDTGAVLPEEVALWDIADAEGAQKPASAHYSHSPDHSFGGGSTVLKIPYVAHIVEQIENEIFDHSILIENELLQISSHVHERLNTFLRDEANELPENNRCLWIQQICVNQSSASDRESAERLTENIYRSAINCRIHDYKYSSLKSNEFRLVNFDGSTIFNLPRITIRTVSLETSPDFVVAESNIMMPESQENEEKVILVCNGQNLRVEQSVKASLQALRSIGKPLWMESICVEQSSPQDVEHHITMRERISQKASNTLTIRRGEYQYQPLRDSKIRLLKIRPSKTFGTPLVIELFTCSLNELPIYTALSYVWGTGERKFGFLCSDGTQMRVTKNLFMTLHELQEKSFDVIWVDQICINQEDYEEKSQQIGLMHRIYREAAGVIVHLGGFCADESHKECREELVPFVEGIAKFKRSAEHEHEGCEIVHSPYELEKHGIPSVKDPRWMKWQLLRSLPWFTRIWVIQEVTNNSNIEVICNRQLFAWRDVVDANNAYGHESISVDSRNIHICRRMLHNVDHFQHDEKQYTLLELLSAFRDHAATDARDKIYALLGMATDSGDFPSPDYRLSMQQVYLSFARTMVKQGQGVALLTEAGSSRQNLEYRTGSQNTTTDVKDRDKSLPSWVPDWSFTSDFYSVHFGKGSAWTSLPAARKVRINFQNAEINLTNDPTVISAEARIVDKIAAVTSKSFDSVSSEDWYSAFDAIEVKHVLSLTA